MEHLQTENKSKKKSKFRRWITKYQFHLMIFVVFLIGFAFGTVLVANVSGAELKRTESNQSLHQIYCKKNIISNSDSKNLNLFEENEWTSFKATGYCPCSKCCGKNDGITATGVKAKQGVTVAADWNVLPAGSIIEIKGLGTYIVQDKGGAIKGNRIDIFFNDHQDALEWGVKDVQVKIIQLGDAK